MRIEAPKASYDVVVIGGGMVGSSFALALAKAVGSVSVLVIDTHELNKSEQPSFDDRSTALSLGSSQILSKIGLWDELAENASKIDTIHVSDKGHIGITQMKSVDYGVDALGYVIENRVFGQAITSSVETSRSIDYFAPAHVNELVPTASGMVMRLSQEGSSFSVGGTLVVLADGGRSSLCSRLGITRDVQDYEQHALIANVEFEQAHQGRAFERFTDTGPLAVLPLTSCDNKNRASLVWTVLASQAEEFSRLDHSELAQRLQERFGDRLGEVRTIGKLLGYPLSLVTAKEQIRPGLVLLGNSAHTLHPVAGQGFNLALRDAEALVASLSAAEKSGKSYGDMLVLQNYLDSQYKDQQRSVLATDTLVNLFSNSSISQSIIRKFGLMSLEFVPGVKKSFAKRAMGLS